MAIVEESAISVSELNLLKGKESKYNCDEDNYFKYSSGYQEEYNEGNQDNI